MNGQTLAVTALDDPGIYELCFNRADGPVNKLDALALQEFGDALQWLRQQPDLRGLLLTSAKDAFIVGANIQEFLAWFAQPAADLSRLLARNAALFTALEDLPVPSMALIRGYALGGGLEMALAASHRVAGQSARLGLPEVTLGIYPGYGGTVRLPRLIGLEAASHWIAQGKQHDAEAALQAGAVDRVVPDTDLRASGLALLRAAIDTPEDWMQRQARKRQAVSDDACIPESLWALARSRNEQHLPATMAVLKLLEKTAPLPASEARDQEAAAFGELARTQAAHALVRTFLDRQSVRRLAQSQARTATPVETLGVLGAGIMGSGIALSGVLAGVPVALHDVSAQARHKAQEHTWAQLDQGVRRALWDTDRRAQAQALLTFADQPDDLYPASLLIEAIVERLDVKQAVLSELERHLRPDAILASNTSSLRIDDIAQSLRRPRQFVGMHFFNPVVRMPLVEIVRGQHTHDTVVAQAVAFALRLGKTPIVVRDCAGFLVNRILTAYLGGFLQLVAEGADFEQVDQAMEAFGWPMGPALLEDVIGLDTGSHVHEVITRAYPQRMPQCADDALRCLLRAGRLGQKNGQGFYSHERDAQGRLQRRHSPEAHRIVAGLQAHGVRPYAPEEIVDRLMLPMIIEAAQALDEGIVHSAAELDIALSLGLGFPRHAAGPLCYADWLGLAEVVRRCERLAALGPAYQPTAHMRDMARHGLRFHDAAPIHPAE